MANGSSIKSTSVFYYSSGRASASLAADMMVKSDSFTLQSEATTDQDLNDILRYAPGQGR